MKQSIQSLGFLIGFQEDIKVPRPHGTINHTIIRVSKRVSRRYQNHNHHHHQHHHHHHHHHCILACPDARCESANLRVLRYIYIALSQIEPAGITDGSTDAYSGSRTKLSPPVQTVRITAKQSRHNFNPQPYVYLCTDTLYTYMCTYIELYIYVYIYISIFIILNMHMYRDIQMHTSSPLLDLHK